ncbi:hypothetical protein M422DRAFT_781230 [Sphaerobolus stellatus SS14]|uniref:Uncharacterized protein n=1 Tax=Sphaerobolus stellatus (strain SS14) TaxID=990650 RepID=A0A0C9VM34_SPHS4|nr:hypothetical protein M422DRAFT_781230 [Sphaerobolus stellatus SS14]
MSLPRLPSGEQPALLSRLSDPQSGSTGPTPTQDRPRRLSPQNYSLDTSSLLHERMDPPRQSPISLSQRLSESQPSSGSLASRLSGPETSTVSTQISTQISTQNGSSRGDATPLNGLLARLSSPITTSSTHPALAIANRTNGASSTFTSNNGVSIQSSIRNNSMSLIIPSTPQVPTSSTSSLPVRDPSTPQQAYTPMELETPNPGSESLSRTAKRSPPAGSPNDSTESSPSTDAQSLVPSPIEQMEVDSIPNVNVEFEVGQGIKDADAVSNSVSDLAPNQEQTADRVVDLDESAGPADPQPNVSSSPIISNAPSIPVEMLQTHQASAVPDASLDYSLVSPIKFSEGPSLDFVKYFTAPLWEEVAAQTMEWGEVAEIRARRRLISEPSASSSPLEAVPVSVPIQGVKRARPEESPQEEEPAAKHARLPSISPNSEPSMESLKEHTASETAVPSSEEHQTLPSDLNRQILPGKPLPADTAVTLPSPPAELPPSSPLGSRAVEGEIDVEDEEECESEEFDEREERAIREEEERLERAHQEALEKEREMRKKNYEQELAIKARTEAQEAEERAKKAQMQRELDEKARQLKEEMKKRFAEKASASPPGTAPPSTAPPSPILNPALTVVKGSQPLTVPLPIQHPLPPRPEVSIPPTVSGQVVAVANHSPGVQSTTSSTSPVVASTTHPAGKAAPVPKMQAAAAKKGSGSPSPKQTSSKGGVQQRSNSGSSSTSVSPSNAKGRKAKRRNKTNAVELVPQPQQRASLVATPGPQMLPGSPSIAPKLTDRTDIATQNVPAPLQTQITPVLATSPVLPSAAPLLIARAAVPVSQPPAVPSGRFVSTSHPIPSTHVHNQTFESEAIKKEVQSPLISNTTIAKREFSASSRAAPVVHSSSTLAPSEVGLKVEETAVKQPVQGAIQMPAKRPRSLSSATIPAAAVKKPRVASIGPDDELEYPEQTGWGDPSIRRDEVEQRPVCNTTSPEIPRTPPITMPPIRAQWNRTAPTRLRDPRMDSRNVRSRTRSRSPRRVVVRPRTPPKDEAYRMRYERDSYRPRGISPSRERVLEPRYRPRSLSPPIVDNPWIAGPGRYHDRSVSNRTPNAIRESRHDSYQPSRDPVDADYDNYLSRRGRSPVSRYDPIPRSRSRSPHPPPPRHQQPARSMDTYLAPGSYVPLTRDEYYTDRRGYAYDEPPRRTSPSAPALLKPCIRVPEHLSPVSPPLPPARPPPLAGPFRSDDAPLRNSILRPDNLEQAPSLVSRTGYVPPPPSQRPASQRLSSSISSMTEPVRVTPPQQPRRRTPPPISLADRLSDQVPAATSNRGRAKANSNTASTRGRATTSPRAVSGRRKLAARLSDAPHNNNSLMNRIEPDN